MQVGEDFHVQGLVRPLLVVALKEVIEARLLLQDIGRRRTGRFGLQRQMQAFVPPILLGMAGRDALEANPQPQPPDRERAQFAPVQFPAGVTPKSHLSGPLPLDPDTARP